MTEKTQGSNDTTIIGLTGMPGSGKGEISEIARDLMIPVRSLGDVVRSFFRDLCPDRDPMETGTFADEQRKEFGKDIWARRLVDEIETLIKDGVKIVIIDGVRSENEVDIFREKWGRRIKILNVRSSPETRFKRLRGRGRNDDPENIEDFNCRDQRELGWGMGEVIDSADIILDNEGSVEDLSKKARKLLEELMD